MAIGDTLGRMPGASTWTDSRSKGIYRRVTLAKERVVGYLSLGPTTPDPLAIKYVIDEGLALSGLRHLHLLKRSLPPSGIVSQDSATQKLARRAE